MDRTDNNLVEAYESIKIKINERKDTLEKRKQEINLVYDQVSIIDRIEQSAYVQVYTNRIKFFEWQDEIEKTSKDEFSRKLLNEKNEIESELQLLDEYLKALIKEDNTCDYLKNK